MTQLSGEVTDLATDEQVEAYLALPLTAGQSRLLDCNVCGAVVYIRVGGNAKGSGNPVKHIRYHRELGEIE